MLTFSRRYFIKLSPSPPSCSEVSSSVNRVTIYIDPDRHWYVVSVLNEHCSIKMNSSKV